MLQAELYARRLYALEHAAGLPPTLAVHALEAVMEANDRQIGGTHYKKGGEEHWDRAWRLKYDPFQYIITKWVERWRDKDGVKDLQKAAHALEKYLELVNKTPVPLPTVEAVFRNDVELGSWNDRPFTIDMPFGRVTTTDQAVAEAALAWMVNQDNKGYTSIQLGKALMVSNAEDLAAYLRAVKPDGWVGYTFEGADGDGFLFTCKACKQAVRVPQYVPPMARHTHDTGEPTTAYTGQD